MAVRKRRAVDRDLELASGIQNYLLPRNIPSIEPFEFDAHYHSASDLGGDYYDFIDHGGGVYGIVVGDAVGKGISAALIMVETRALVHAAAAQTKSPAEILRKVNRVLYTDLQPGLFVSLFYALVDVHQRTVTVASAGHTPLLLSKKRDAQCYVKNPKGTVLGISAPRSFNRIIEEDTFRVQTGDRFLLYTDGVTDTEDEGGNQFGQDRLAKALLDSAHQSSQDCLKHLLGTLQTHRGEAESKDDLTLITCRLAP